MEGGLEEGMIEEGEEAGEVEGEVEEGVSEEDIEQFHGHVRSISAQCHHVTFAAYTSPAHTYPVSSLSAEDRTKPATVADTVLEAVHPGLTL